MVGYICDRCGKTFEQNEDKELYNAIAFGWRDGNIAQVTTKENFFFDLCGDCMEDLKKFLEEKKDG